MLKKIRKLVHFFKAVFFFLLIEFSQSQNRLPFYQNDAVEVDIGKLSSIQLNKLLEKHPYLRIGGNGVSVNTDQNFQLNNEVKYII